VRIAITTNGPGEFSGWVRPLVSALLRLAPDTQVTLIFVPDDFATGREPAAALALFPDVGAVPASEYVAFALGRSVAGVPESVDVVQYLGGDLMHAARAHARLGGLASTYKFSRARYRALFDPVFAVDAKNAADLERWRTPAERIDIVGNLAIDGAFGEEAGLFRPPGAATADDARVLPGGVLFMPGTRRHEVAQMFPFFLATAERLAQLAPELPVAFAASPFTTNDAIGEALAEGGLPNFWGARGRVVEETAGPALQAERSGASFPLVREAMRYARRARLVATLPGTKCIELAALGVPAIVLTPANAPERVVINGPFQYIDRIPFLGDTVKRAVVLAVDRRFPMTAQPNIDAGEEVMPEMRGTQMPGHVARRILEYAADDGARAAASQRLRGLYAHHAGASERMARALLAKVAG
jgi:lipid-A-disaccharide synthase